MHDPGLCTVLSMLWDDELNETKIGHSVKRGLPLRLLSLGYFVAYTPLPRENHESHVALTTWICVCLGRLATWPWCV